MVTSLHQLSAVPSWDFMAAPLRTQGAGWVGQVTGDKESILKTPLVAVTTLYHAVAAVTMFHTIACGNVRGGRHRGIKGK